MKPTAAFSVRPPHPADAPHEPSVAAAERPGRAMSPPSPPRSPSPPAAAALPPAAVGALSPARPASPGAGRPSVPPPADAAGLTGWAPLPGRLSRADFADARVVAWAGREIARLHAEAPAAQGAPPLYLVDDAERRLRRVQKSADKQAACSLDVARVDTFVARLGGRLAAAAGPRVHAAFNLYPEAITVSDAGTLVSRADDDNVGDHAFFEPLARLGYTARLGVEAHARLLEAYTTARFGRQASAAEQRALLEAKALFDVMYHLYFVDIAFDPAPTGTEARLPKADCLQQARLLLPRIDADEAALADPSLPPLT